jgi:hypothetical protein
MPVVSDRLDMNKLPSKIWLAIPILVSLFSGPERGHSESLISKATQIFGPPLNVEHMVFTLGGNRVLWLIADVKGELIAADVGNKSDYVTEFPNAAKAVTADLLTQEEYSRVIQLISKLKEIGKLRDEHGPAVSSDFGLIETDQFERAFVERTIQATAEGRIRKFWVYFLQNAEASPEEIADVPPPTMVCFAEMWYYVPSEVARGLRLGEWQKFQVAGPALRRYPGCHRTTPVKDADGFTIEQPQNETVVLSTPFRVRQLAGVVQIGTNAPPIESANVEFRRIGTTTVLRTTTDAYGKFSLPPQAEGQYKFKVTKDGFKALRGTVTVDKHAPMNARLPLVLHVGT